MYSLRKIVCYCLEFECVFNTCFSYTKSWFIQNTSYVRTLRENSLWGPYLNSIAQERIFNGGINFLLHPGWAGRTKRVGRVGISARHRKEGRDAVHSQLQNVQRSCHSNADLVQRHGETHQESGYTNPTECTCTVNLHMASNDKSLAN